MSSLSMADEKRRGEGGVPCSGWVRWVQWTPCTCKYLSTRVTNLCVVLSLQSDHFPRSQIYLSGCNVSDVTAKTDKKGKTFFAFRISHPHTTRDFRLSSKEQVGLETGDGRLAM